MNIKHYSAISCLLLLSHNTQAFEWDVYGKLDLQALYVDEGLYRYSDQGLQLEAPFTRLGFKASHDLTDNLKLIMVYEWQVNGLDDANKDHRLGSRNTYIGVAGNWGSWFLVKMIPALKSPKAKLIYLMKP
nr:porin [Rheinheimera soli]